MLINSIFCLYFTILSHGFAGSCFQTSMTQGDAWLKADRFYNEIFVNGFKQGFDLGSRIIIGVLQTEGILTEDKAIAAMIDEYAVQGINASQVCEGIDEIYKDYSNRHIKPAGLILLVCDKIKGKKDQAEFEKELQRLRTIFK